MEQSPPPSAPGSMDTAPPGQGPQGPSGTPDPSGNPFAPPQASSLPGASPAGGWNGYGYAEPTPVAPYTPGGTVATVTIVMLVLTALTYVVAIFVWVEQMGLLAELAAGKSISEGTASSAEMRTLGVTWGGIAMRLFTAIPFCIWFARMHRNLPALGAGGLQYTPGWAAGSFFVPILNWYRPYQIGAEIWDASTPDADPSNPYHWKFLRGAPIIGVWWALFLGPGFVDRFVGKAFEKSSDPKALRTAMLIAIILELSNLAAAAVTIFMIRKIHQRQSAKHQKLEALRLAQPMPCGYPAPAGPPAQQPYGY